MAATEQRYGTLYVCGTPIGNLADLSARALETLRSVDLIAAEDTRQIAKLLARHGVSTPTRSYHAHNLAARTAPLIERLQAGESIAVVSDAGMPGISDPGSELVAAALAAQVPVVAVPGPVAAIAALVVSGLPTDRWVFEGFLPREGKARRRLVKTLAGEQRTLVFYEAPHRLLAMLADLTASFGPTRRVAVARELTKLHEEVFRGSLEEALAHFGASAPRGEFTVVVAGAPAAEPEAEDLTEHLRSLLAQGLSTQDASRQLARQTGRSRRDLYQQALALWEEK